MCFGVIYYQAHTQSEVSEQQSRNDTMERQWSENKSKISLLELTTTTLVTVSAIKPC